LKKVIHIKEGINLPEKIIGISSQSTDYKIAWEINNLLNIELKKYPDKIVENADFKEIRLSYYYCKGENNEKYFIMQNAVSGYSLLPKLKNINFFFIIFNTDDDRLKQFQKILNSAHTFLGCFMIALNKQQINKLKSILKK
jgi:hypothetical protein